MAVHLYGHPAELGAILKIARKHKIKVVEDAAEAHGAEYRGGKVGGIGDVGCFSFYANKLITCGEGGMVVTNSRKIYEKLKSLKDLAHSKSIRFLHKEIGFNYRMTNLQAALGLAQLEEIESYIKIKRWMAQQYNKMLKGVNWLELPVEETWAKSTFWMYAVKIREKGAGKREKIREFLKQKGVDTRSFFYPLHKQPVLKKMGLFKDEKYPISEDLSKRGFYLPSGLAITSEQIKTVTLVLKTVR